MMTGNSSKVGFQSQVALPAVRERVERILADRGKTLTWLFAQVGITKTGYREMWERESVRIVVIQRIANCLEVDIFELLREEVSTTASVREPPSAYGTRTPYLEERIEALEREMRTLKHQLKK